MSSPETSFDVYILFENEEKIISYYESMFFLLIFQTTFSHHKRNSDRGRRVLKTSCSYVAEMSNIHCSFTEVLD